MTTIQMPPNTFTKFLFDSEYGEKHGIDDSDLIKLIPFGVSVSSDISRPILILKDEKMEHTLPVPVSPLEAGVTLSQCSKASLPVSPHKVSQLLLESLNIKIKKCVFIEIKGAHQYVNLYLTGHPKLKCMKIRADEAMSLVLYLETPIYSTREYMAKSRTLNAEMEGIEKGLLAHPDMTARRHPYIM